MTRPRPSLMLLATLAALPRPAGAVGEDEAQAAASASWGWLETRGHGGVLRLEGQYGVTDGLALHATAGASWHGATAARAVAVEAGVTYALDILRVVPFGEAGLCVLGVAAGARGMGLQVGLGGEYLIDRHWALALVVRYAYLPLRLGGGPGRPSLLGAGLRLGYVF